MRLPSVAMLLAAILYAVSVLANISLIGLLRASVAREQTGRAQELAELRRAASALAAERARLAESVMRLLTMREDRASETVKKSEPATEADGPVGRDSVKAQEEADAPPQDPDGAPRWAKTELIAPGELEDLQVRRDDIPMPRPDDVLLLQGNADAVVADARWNPKARALSTAEREELKKLMDSYQYFARQARAECMSAIIKPSMDQMAQAGAFVEYSPGERGSMPPTVEDAEGVVQSVSGPGQEPGTRRLYYFFRGEHPEFYHEQQVEVERSLECYVKAYELLNGGGK